jgi:hypothetical protein
MSGLVDAESPFRRAAVVLVAASVGLTAVHVALSLAHAAPAGAPAYLSILMSALIGALNLAAIVCDARSQPRSVESRLLACGLALIGPLWVACVWNAGFATFAWCCVLLVGGGGASILWATLPIAKSPAATASATPQIAPETCTHSPQSHGPRLADSEEAHPAGVLQRMERRIHGDAEIVEIEWRIKFAAGEQQRSLHFPIAPALGQSPQVECEPLDGPDLDIAVGAALPYGVRLDVRRIGDATVAATALIGIVLQAPAVAAAA